MGIVDRELADFTLSAYDDCQVELDVNGSIHLHLDNIRLEFSEREFVEFVDLLEEGQQELRETKS